jgi:hypothetical protein
MSVLMIAEDTMGAGGTGQMAPPSDLGLGVGVEAGHDCIDHSRVPHEGLRVSCKAQQPLVEFEQPLPSTIVGMLVRSAITTATRCRSAYPVPDSWLVEDVDALQKLSDLEPGGWPGFVGKPVRKQAEAARGFQPVF